MHQLDRAAGAPSGFSGHTTKHKCECESLLHQKQRRPEGRPTTLAGPGSPVRYTPGEGTSRPTHYTQYTQMTNLLFRRRITMRILVAMKGRNNCLWLKLVSEELCNRSCMGEFCKVHLALLRKGSRVHPCKICGKGVRNSLMLCRGCGYVREWCHRQKIFAEEFERLCRIENPI